MKNKIIRSEHFDEERALYGLAGCTVADCDFSGPADGESPIKECRDIEVTGCRFGLRYPMWHCEGLTVTGTEFSENCRAPFWYTSDAVFSDVTLQSVKAFRECRNIKITDSVMHSEEFGWKCSGFDISNLGVSGPYAFFECRDSAADRLFLDGKYSFQYTENIEIRNSVLRTKDAFWHSRNVTVYDSEISGEYLGWYSRNLRLVRCRISGTQPLCYAEGLVLEDCTMEKTDLSFERSDVRATVIGHVDSIKNPLSGHIAAGSVGEIIRDIPGADCPVEITGK